MKNLLWIGLPTILILSALIGSIFIYKACAPTPSPIPTPSSLPTETPEITPTPELKRQNLQLEILNGRGVAGTAAEAKTYLESLGYQNIETANANSHDYEKTEISIKKDKEDYLKQLITDLSDGFRVSKNTKILDEESEFDAIVIIGKE